MLKRASAICLLIVFFCTSLTACGDANEIDNAIYPIVVGIERGTNYKIRVVIQYQTYKGGGGGTSQSQKTGKGDEKDQNQVEGSNIHAIEASSFLEAINLFNIAVSRKVSLTHTKMLVISEEFAREGIEKYAAPIRRFREIRPAMQMVVVNGDVESFIRDNKANIGESLSKADELMLTQSREHGFFPMVTFHDFYEAMVSPYNEPYAIYAGLNNTNLPSLNQPENIAEKSSNIQEHSFLPGEAPRTGVAKREFAGCAVFAGGKMVGTLESYETRYLLMVTGKFNRGIMTSIDKRDPQSVVPLEIRLGRKPKISVKIQDGKPQIIVDLKLEADLGAVQSRIQYEDINMITELNNTAKETIEKGVKRTIEKTQKELKSDVFGFGFYAAKNFTTIQEFAAYNWLTKYPDAEVNVTVDFNIRRTGLMIKSAPVISSGKNIGGE